MTSDNPSPGAPGATTAGRRFSTAALVSAVLVGLAIGAIAAFAVTGFGLPSPRRTAAAALPATAILGADSGRLPGAATHSTQHRPGVDTGWMGAVTAAGTARLRPTRSGPGPSPSSRRK